MAASFMMQGYMMMVGAIVGSFLLVAAMRESLAASVLGRSRCMYCQKQLSAWELVPVVAYVFLKGKCRSCRKPISIYYPLVELIGAGLFLLAWIVVEPGVELGIALLLFAMLLLISITDITRMVIPNAVLLMFGVPLIGLRVLFNPIEGSWYTLVAGTALIITFILASAANKIGGGDVKLFLLLAVVLGFESFIYTVALSSLLALGYASCALLTKRMSKNTRIPFAPFISIATCFIYFSVNTV